MRTNGVHRQLLQAIAPLNGPIPYCYHKSRVHIIGYIKKCGCICATKTGMSIAQSPSFKVPPPQRTSNLIQRSEQTSCPPSQLLISLLLLHWSLANAIPHTVWISAESKLRSTSAAGERVSGHVQTSIQMHKGTT